MVAKEVLQLVRGPIDSPPGALYHFELRSVKCHIVLLCINHCVTFHSRKRSARFFINNGPKKSAVLFRGRRRLESGVEPVGAELPHLGGEFPVEGFEGDDLHLRVFGEGQLDGARDAALFDFERDGVAGFVPVEDRLQRSRPPDRKRDLVLDPPLRERRRRQQEKDDRSRS
ncbi:MAG: hypothetical protein ACKVX9_07350 [Blastocatellia bacterium]